MVRSTLFGGASVVELSLFVLLELQTEADKEFVVCVREGELMRVTMPPRLDQSRGTTRIK
jgi:hypothetical protein